MEETDIFLYDRKLNLTLFKFFAKLFFKKAEFFAKLFFKKAEFFAKLFFKKAESVPKGIRTPDLSLRRRTLYPTELLAHFYKNNTGKPKLTCTIIS